MRIEGVRREITKNHPENVLINVCVPIAYYLFILVTLKAESLLINSIQLIKI